MPIIGFNCPVCKRPVALDHYAVTDCGLKIPADYATAILHDQDDRYVTDEVTVTAGLGCPRSRAIERDIEVLVDPLSYNALLIGRAWDQLMEKHAPEGTAKIELEGIIEGIHIFGEIDRVAVYGDKVLIIDHKHSNNFAQKFAKKEGVKLEHKVQTSLYAELYAQQFPGKPRPTHGLIFNHYSGATAEPLTPFIYDLMTVAECLAHKPYGGDFTVLELYQQAERYFAWKKGTGALRCDVFELPLAGVSMKFGAKSMCDYCAVRAPCMEAAGGAPF